MNIINCPRYKSGTPLNGHPSKANTHDITDNSESPDCSPIHFILKQPLKADTSLLRITDSFHGPNCTRTILNDPDLADTRRPFQQDCPPSLL